MAVHSDRGVPLSTLCPKFLHTNSTSHTSPFSAIAELIDNAYDPDVGAKQFWIDKSEIKGQECLTFMDNGNGLDRDSMHKMLSFGYSDKTTINGVAPIGIYGNGFKSGSMRLGKDAIVFSKSKTTTCVGMLSQTYLKEINANQIIVPVVCFEQTKGTLSVPEEDKASLQDILHYSPFTTQEELHTELSAITPPWSTGKTGTRIIIWNLRRKSDGQLELDFERDRYDMRMPSDVYEVASNNPQHPNKVSSYIPESVYSLRAYCRVLYLKPRMQIMIRGQKVKSQLIAKSLASRRTDHYKPSFLNKRIPITFGYNTKSKDQYGMMMYHKNRLIKAYERVGCQNRANNQGVGVIGVIECNFLNPTHNKQSFDDTDKYRKTMYNLGIKLEDYWKEIRYRWERDNPNSTTPVEDAMKRPDQNWVQCDDCLKWRKLPDGIDNSKLPDKWLCMMNTDPQYRSCQVEEEPEDSDDERPSYSKTFKQQERETKKQQELKRQKEVEDQWRQQLQQRQQVANLTRALKQQQIRELHQKTPLSPQTPTTPRRQFKTNQLTLSTISQADCSPSTSDGLPVISNVFSLAAGPLGRKRTQPVNTQAPPKRSRENGSHANISDTYSSVDVSPSGPVVKDENDDTDDDVSILENDSTPKPDNLGFSLTKVKTENETGNANVCMGIDAAVNSAVETNAAKTSSTGANPSPAPPTELTSTTTQTAVHEIKDENQITVNTGDSINEQRQNNHTNGADTPREKQTLQNGVAHHLEGKNTAGPSCVSTESEQPGQLKDLQEATAEERDSYKGKVDTPSRQLQIQRKVLNLTQTSVKKECSHQASQTEELEGVKDYKSLFEATKRKVDELIQEQKALLAATERKNSAREWDFDVTVNSLRQELEQKIKENDQLRSQLDSVEKERANLATQCEELRLSLQQHRENAEEEGSTTQQRTANLSVQTDAEDTEGTATSGTHSSSDTLRSLIELRHNVARLLVTRMPALDLSQLNYECNVIDEMLEQVCEVGWAEDLD